MTNPSIPAPMTPVVAIGIRNLPDLSGNMLGGGLYALKAETPSARFPMLAGSLASALGVGMSCTVIVPAKPELFIERIESFGNINALEMIETGRMQVFVTKDEFSKTIFRFGAEGFVKELEQMNVPENSYLIFDQADELLSLHDVSIALNQIDVLRAWFSQRQVTGLLVFSRNSDENSKTINALMDSLTGVARLGAGRDGLEITFEYWQSPEGTLAARSYPLLAVENGYYEATAYAANTSTVVVQGQAPVEFAEPVDEGVPHYFYLDPDLSSLAERMPGVWEQVDTLVGMLHATRHSRSAISILSFRRDTQLRQLAETVHTLRQTLGRRARIVVLEKDASLRYQNEALLLRLGINLVVHRDVPLGRLPLLLESLQGQVFNRDVDINFEAALASVLPLRLRGYLPVPKFEHEVKLLLERSETLNIPCVLIVGKPATITTPLELLKNLGLARDGDLTSSDGQRFFLFLNACPPSVMRTTLDTILGASAETVFESTQYFAQPEEIQAALADLVNHAEQNDLPDYSSLISTATDASLATPASPKPSKGGLFAALAPAQFTRPSVPAPTTESTGRPRASANSADLPSAAAGKSAASGAPVPQFRYDTGVAAPVASTKEFRRATRSTAVTDQRLN